MIEVGQGFRWTETYSVRIEQLDRQHQGLFDVINQLKRRPGNGSRRDGDGWCPHQAAGLREGPFCC